MLVVVYFELNLAHPTPPVLIALRTLILFLAASVGIAGFGYMLNDLCDVEQDLKSGTRNLVAQRGRVEVLIRFALVLLLAWLPWRWLPTSRPIWALLAFEFALFLAYSIPPIRFKERGILGPVADALYAYTVPTAVSMLVFAQLGHVVVPLWFGLLLGIWTSLLGLRHILIHQLEDAARDQLSGFTTFVTQRGWRQAFDLLNRGLQPVENGLFLVFLLALAVRVPLMLVGLSLYMLFYLSKQRDRGIWQEANPWRLPAIDKVLFLITLSSEFQTDWLPLLILIPLAVQVPSYLLMVALHYLLFNNGIKTLLRYELPERRRLRQLA